MRARERLDSEGLGTCPYDPVTWGALAKSPTSLLVIVPTP